MADEGHIKAHIFETWKLTDTVLTYLLFSFILLKFRGCYLPVEKNIRSS